MKQRGERGGGRASSSSVGVAGGGRYRTSPPYPTQQQRPQPQPRQSLARKNTRRPVYPPTSSTVTTRSARARAMNTEVTDLLNLIDDSMIGGGDNLVVVRTTTSDGTRQNNRAKEGRFDGGGGGGRRGMGVGGHGRVSAQGPGLGVGVHGVRRSSRSVPKVRYDVDDDDDDENDSDYIDGDDDDDDNDHDDDDDDDGDDVMGRNNVKRAFENERNERGWNERPHSSPSRTFSNEPHRGSGLAPGPGLGSGLEMPISTTNNPSPTLLNAATVASAMDRVQGLSQGIDEEKGDVGGSWSSFPSHHREKEMEDSTRISYDSEYDDDVDVDEENDEM